MRAASARGRLCRSWPWRLDMRRCWRMSGWRLDDDDVWRCDVVELRPGCSGEGGRDRESDEFDGVGLFWAVDGQVSAAEDGIDSEWHVDPASVDLVAVDRSLVDVCELASLVATESEPPDGVADLADVI